VGVLCRGIGRAGAVAKGEALTAAGWKQALVESVTNFLLRVGRLASLSCLQCGSRLCFCAAIPRAGE